MNVAGKEPNTNIFQIPVPWWAAVASVPAFASVFQTGTVFEVSGSVVTDAIIADRYTIQWATGAAILGLLIAVAITPWLRGRVGKRQIYIWGLTLFAVGSLIEAGSWNVTSMTVGRLVSGLGKGFVIANLRAMLFATLKDSLPLAIAFYGMVGYASRAISPVTSAYLVDYLSWRSVYLVETLLAIGGLLLTYRFLADDRPAQPSKDPLDSFGLALWIATLVGIIVLIDRGQRWGYWTSNTFVLIALLTLGTGITFLVWEWRAPQPLMNLRYLLRIRTYVLAQFSKSIFLCVLYSVLALIAKYMLALRGYPRTTSGWVLVPMGLGMLLTMFSTALSATAGSDRVKKLTEDSRQLRLILGMGLASITVWQLAEIDLYTSKYWTSGVLFLVGSALGMVVLPVLAYAQYGLDPKYAAYAASIGLTVLVLPITLVEAGTDIAMVRWTDTYTDSLSLALEDGRAVLENVTAHVTLVLAEKGGEPSLEDKVKTVLADWQRDNASFCAYQTVLRWVAFLPLLGIIAAIAIEPAHFGQTCKSCWQRMARRLHNAAAQIHPTGA